MDRDKTAYFRRFLVKKMQTLLTTADNTIHKLKITDGKFADPLDQAAAEESKSIELNCRSQEWHLLLDIKETILRIDSGLFGICDHCGRPISQKRLRVAPMSKLCVDCQKKTEHGATRIRPRNQGAGRISYHHA